MGHPRHRIQDPVRDSVRRYSSQITLVLLAHRSTPPHSRLPLTQHPPLHRVRGSWAGPVVRDRGKLQLNVYVVMDRFSGNFRSPPILWSERCIKTGSRGVACPLSPGLIGSLPPVSAIVTPASPGWNPYGVRDCGSLLVTIDIIPSGYVTPWLSMTYPLLEGLRWVADRRPPGLLGDLSLIASSLY